MRHILALIITAAITASVSAAPVNENWKKDFKKSDCEFSSDGKNAYFVLEPGFQMTYENVKEKAALQVTVLHATKTVDGVITRVVEEKELKNGQVVEISKNYFAFCKNTRSVYYFGEDVDIYKDGKVTGHAGSWLSGVNGAQYGLWISSRPAMGQRYYMESAPGVAMDRAEVVRVNDKLDTLAGSFANCIVIEETTPLEPGKKEYKVYAPGMGLVKDGYLKLVKYGSVKQ